MNESKLFTTGQRQVERGQHRAAAQTYAKLLEQDPDNVQALLFLGDVYHRLEDEPRAADAFVRAAEVYSRQGDALKALTVHRQAVELLPGSPEAHAALGHLCLQQGKGAEAMDAFGRAMECFEERGGRLGGLRLIYDILKSGPGDLPSWLRVGEGFSALGHVKEASRALRVLALRLHGENRKDAFRLVAERLLYHDANESAVARRLAESYLRDGLATRALPALRIACRAAPRDLELLGLLRDALVSLGHEDNAVVVLKTMARLYEEAGHLAERDTCYDQILDLRPDDEGVRHAMDPPRTVGDMPTIVLEPAAPVVRPPTLTKAQEMAFAPAEQGFGEPVTAQVVSVEEEGLEAPITAQVVSVEQMGTH
ncbi:MAG: tetratricopeptide repeat protein, partial [Myxococcota bacterium]|nr:tetratricopeptide repeat protein [Myxococcota bacterium]